MIPAPQLPPSGLSPDFPEMSPDRNVPYRQADPQVSPAPGPAQGPGGGPLTTIEPLCAIEIATPTREAAISTDQKMIAM